jgi:hypothetical protein
MSAGGQHPPFEGFHDAVDCVARERKYLAFLEAPPLASTRQSVMNNIANGYPQFVAVADGTVVGWCDVIPKERPVHAHCGVLGIGLLIRPFTETCIMNRRSAPSAKD